MKKSSAVGLAKAAILKNLEENFGGWMAIPCLARPESDACKNKNFNF